MNAGGDTDGGKFISFADSRQDAAFFAVYLERTYAKVSRRRLILEALRHNWRVEGGPVAMEDVAKELRTLAEQAGFFDVRMSTVERRRTAMSWLTAEMTAMDRRQSLEGVGLAVRRLRRPAKWKAPAEMRAFPWELDDDEAWTVIETLMLTLVDAQVMTFPDGVDHTNAIFAPRNRPSFVREASSHAPSRTAAWVPASASARNRRTDYLIRVLSRKGIGDLGGARVAAVNLLQFIWQGITRPGALLAPYMVATNDQKTGTRYQPDYAFWEWEEPSDGLLGCSHCGLRAGRSVLGVCPALRCQGTMEPRRPDEDDHYRFTYQSAGGGSMRVEEHTAQWTARQAAEIQQRFLDGDIDVLSCSTTFELGVDVGDLQTVFLRNIPPAAANYVQRAGRAGRRRDAVAFVLSYAQLRPHDQHIFRIADELVAGRVPVPRVPAANERVVRRHVHSVALSRFFRTVLPPGSDRWTNVGRFFIENRGEALEQFREWLRRREPELQAELARVVPQDVQNDLGVSSWEWAEALLDPDSPLGRAEGDVAEDEATFGRLMTEAAEAKEFRRAGYYQHVLNSVHSQYLLGFLAARNVLPKYGFPVDVVTLKTNHLQAKEATQLDLDRDLRVAISEFAPGAGVVAAKKLWVSAGVRLLPNRALPLRDYVRCDSCHRIELDQETGGACPLCGGDVRKELPMIEPMYGFIAGEPDARSLGDERPLRLFASDVHFVRHHKDTPQARKVLVEVGPCEPVLLGRYARHAELAVLNTGRKRGFQFCERCGFARLAPLVPPRRSAQLRHNDPESGRPCGNTHLQRVALGHKFSTDVVEFVLPGFVPHGEPLEQLSQRVGVLSAIAEGAARSLHIRREDLDTTFYIEGGNTVFVLYDSVPGGAGLAREIFADAGGVIAAALDVVGRCECGADSSCYGCIRTYRNQQQHDALNRGLVADALQPVVDAAFASPP
ncbi:MAG: DUF1998 domain-containing protein [Thermoflexaceae bacterium]|nr:DUF1998 domain-containing protein [Thermoflexaceae bacterium]